MKALTIGEVARYAGVQTSAIRYYESVGLLPAPKRINGRRAYDAGVLKRLGLIHLVRQAGFGIRELQILFSGMNSGVAPESQWRRLAAGKVAAMDALIERTQAARDWLAEALQTGCNGVEECVTITFDEQDSGMKITLSCGMREFNGKSLNLMTMPLPE